MPRLRKDLLKEVNQAILQAGMVSSRLALFSGITSYMNTLDQVSNPGAQLLSDLAAMNDAEPFDDGTDPLACWLDNAATLAGPRVQRKVFERALLELKGAGGGGGQAAVTTAAPSVHFLDSLPFNFSLPGAQELQRILTSVYWNAQLAVALLRSVELSPAKVNLNQSMDLAWSEILIMARNQEKLRPLVDKVLADPDATAWYPRLRELKDTAPAAEAKAPAPWTPAPVVARDEKLERQIEDRSTLLFISFLELGLRAAQSVARLLVRYPSGEAFVGTGFRIGENLLLTNHHVLYGRDGASPSKVEIRFRYEVDERGNEIASDFYDGDPTSISGEAADDWAIIRTTTPLPASYPILPLAPKRVVKIDDRVCIIQHPQGGPKQIGLYHNDVRYVDDKVVQYRTDTLGGSSGSPVFNEQWEVVALHHSWAQAQDPSGRDKFWNEGIRIEQVMNRLAANNIAI